MEAISVDQAIEVLNRMLEKDYVAVHTLIFQRVPCTEELANDETVQVGWIDGVYRVGLLGVLNGIFGIQSDGMGYIQANFDNKGYLMDFSRTPPPKED